MEISLENILNTYFSSAEIIFLFVLISNLNDEILSFSISNKKNFFCFYVFYFFFFYFLIKGFKQTNNKIKLY